MAPASVGGVLFNGIYSVLITSDGDGFSSCGGIMVNGETGYICPDRVLYIHQDMEEGNFGVQPIIHKDQA